MKKILLLPLLVIISSISACGGSGVETGNPIPSKGLRFEPRGSSDFYNVTFGDNHQVVIERSTSLAGSNQSSLTLTNNSIFSLSSFGEAVGAVADSTSDELRLEAEFSDREVEVRALLDGETIESAALLIDGESVESDIYSGFSRKINDMVIDASGTVTLLGTQSYSRVGILHTDGTVTAPDSTEQISTLFLARFLSSGSLDPTFGVSGVIFHNLGYSNPNIQGVRLVRRSDGRLLAGGYSSSTTGSIDSSFLALFNSDGTQNTSFGTSGLSTVEGLLVQMGLTSTEKIVVASNENIFRYTSSGVLDTTFSSPSDASPSTGRVINDFKILSEDRLVVLSYFQESDTDPSTIDAGILYLTKYLADGPIDTSFATSGETSLRLDFMENATANLYQQYRLTVLPSGSFLVGGSNIYPLNEGTGSLTGTNYGYYFLTRFSSGGSLDTSFGTLGISKERINASTPPLFNDYLGYFVQAVDSTGTIYVATDSPISTYTASGDAPIRFDWDTRLFEYSASGQKNTSFHSTGYWDQDNTLSFATPPRYSDGTLMFLDGYLHLNDFPTAMVVGADNRLYLAVYAENPFLGSVNDSVIVRYE